MKIMNLCRFLQITLFLSFLAFLRADELVMVQELFRHGARNTIWEVNDWEQYAKDMGQLTNVGMREHYLLGKFLRKRYIEDLKFLDDKYNEQQIRVYSTDKDRTITSAESSLQGLYGELKGGQIPTSMKDDSLPPWNEQITVDDTMQLYALPLGYPAIPIHSNSYDQEKTLRSFDQLVCPNYVIEKQKNLHSEALQQVMDSVSDSLKFFCEVTGEEYPPTIVTVYQYVDSMYTYYFENPPAVNPLKDKFPQNVWDDINYLYVMYQYIAWFQTEEQLKFTSTPFFEALLDNFQNIFDNPDIKTKFYMLSAHDSTISMIFSVIGISSWQCQQEIHQGTFRGKQCMTSFPGYATSMMFEMWQKDGQSAENPDSYYIKILLNGEYVLLCEDQVKECPYTQFYKERVDYFMGGQEKWCGRDKVVVQDDITKVAEISTAAWITFGCSLGVLLGGSIFFGIMFKHYKSA